VTLGGVSDPLSLLFEPDLDHATRGIKAAAGKRVKGLARENHAVSIDEFPPGDATRR
jgi:hypothetical protein